MDRVSRFAPNIFLLGYAFLVIESSVRHILTHVLAHGVGGTAAEERAMATTLFAAAAGIHIAFLLKRRPLRAQYHCPGSANAMSAASMPLPVAITTNCTAPGPPASRNMTRVAPYGQLLLYSTSTRGSLPEFSQTWFVS